MSIEPTIGRNIWFHCTETEAHELGMARYDDQPMHANIVYIHSPTSINLAVADHGGMWHQVYRVPVNVPINSEDSVPYAAWMPYQQGQAKIKTDHRHVQADGSLTLGAVPFDPPPGTDQTST